MSTWESIDAENIVRHRSGTYYLSAKINGKKVRKSLQTKSIRVAKIKRDEMVKQLRSVSLSPGNGVVSIEGGIRELAFQFENDPSLKPTSIAYYKDILELMIETLPSDKAPRALTETVLQKWFNCFLPL